MLTLFRDVFFVLFLIIYRSNLHVSENSAKIWGSWVLMIFLKRIISPLPSVFIKVCFHKGKTFAWEWLLKYFKVGSVFSFKVFFFLSDFRSKLALKVDTNTVCVGSRFLMLFTWFWGIIPANLKASPALARQAGCGLTTSKVWGILLKNKVIKIWDLHIRQTGFVPCLGEDWVKMTEYWVFEFRLDLIN